MPFVLETHRLGVRVAFFNVLNHPAFTWDGAVSDGNVRNPFVNQVHLNGGGNRSGRIHVRSSS